MFDLDTLKNTQFPVNPAWLNRLREWQLEAFIERGFPTRKEEAWKYFDLAHLAKETFTPLPISKAPDDFKPPILPGHTVLVFFNGTFQPEYSHLNSLPDEVILLPISQAFETHKEEIQAFLEINDPKNHPFVSLNAAFLSDGLFLCIPPHTALKKPIHCLHFNNQEQGVWHTRNILTLGENAQATILEHFKGNHTTYLHNTVTQISLDKASILNYYKIQQESSQAYHLSNIQVSQKADSSLSTFHATVGGHLSRDDLHIKLEGKGAHCNLKGFYATRQKQCVDHHILTEHLSERTQSNQHYKGILKDQSKAIFNGKVKVHTNAHQTIAHQSNQNILLSGAAEVDTKPELEIYNEDVKCTHGATVGPLEQEAIFYLQSRGMNREQAAHLLIEAFFNELIAPIPYTEITQTLNALKTHEML